MELSDMKEYLDERRKLGSGSVYFFGGEPFLYFDLLTEGIKHARKIGLEPAVLSNGFWATYEQLATKRLRLLREIGINHISLSVDPFHREYVPLEHVRNAIEGAKSLGMSASVQGNCYFTGKDGGDDLLRHSREITAKFLRLGSWEPHATPGVMLCGTAAEVLAKHAPMQPWQEYSDLCHMVELSKESSRGMNSVCVDPSGNVSPGGCLGISIGNAKETKMSEIVTTYRPHAHPILGPLFREGAVGLARMAKKRGFEPTEYASSCHLCYETRKALLEHYPRHLAPAIYYEKAK